MTIEKATLGCGCFWCFEAVFQRLQGVEEVRPGYSGGTLSDPSYEQVCTGTTDHAEVLQIQFDPDLISFRTLLQVFFSIHNPTTLNRQGADVGTQYRSVIFHHNNEQKSVAEKLISELNDTQQWDQPIVTEVTPVDIFYEAEEYHHNYYNSHTTQPYCQAVISPKLTKLHKEYGNLLKPGKIT